MPTDYLIMSPCRSLIRNTAAASRRLMLRADGAAVSKSSKAAHCPALCLLLISVSQPTTKSTRHHRPGIIALRHESHTQQNWNFLIQFRNDPQHGHRRPSDAIWRHFPTAATNPPGALYSTIFIYYVTFSIFLLHVFLSVCVCFILCVYVCARVCGQRSD